MPAAQLWTIGHSAHPMGTFLEILQAWGIETVIDVRRFPGSRRQPQFASAALDAALHEGGVAYRWIEGLGGRRRPDFLDAEGSAWRHPSFRAYAQYMRSDQFADGLHALLHAAHATRTAIMCSELLWWRCHRRLISDVMVLGGWEVTHILDPKHGSTHRLDAPAHVTPAGLSYEEPHCC